MLTEKRKNRYNSRNVLSKVGLRYIMQNLDIGVKPLRQKVKQNGPFELQNHNPFISEIYVNQKFVTLCCQYKRQTRQEPNT